MFRTATLLLVLVFQVLAFREAEVAPLIQDQPTLDAPVVELSGLPLGASFTALSAEGVDGPETDPLKTALLEQESSKESEPLELPNCSGGKLQLLSATYKVTQQIEIQEQCNVSSQGAKLFLSAPLVFLKTAWFEGKLFVKGSGSVFGPCFLVKGDAFVPASAELSFAACHNVAQAGWRVDGKGGAIRVGGNLTVVGSLSIGDSSASGSGGGICVERNFMHSGGSILISNASASYGGGIYVGGNFMHSGGNIAISNASAGEWGGGICVGGNFMHSGGNIAISNASAGEWGGGICVERNFMHSSGSILISNSSAKYGGGIRISNFAHSGGDIYISNSSARSDGGGIYVKQNFVHSAGSLSIKGSSAGNYGGGMYVEYGNFVHSGGNIAISNASAEYHGGGMNVEYGNFTHSRGSLSISNSWAGSNGGGMYVEYGNFVHSGGSILISNSSAGSKGGGIYVTDNFTDSGGSIAMTNSSAQKDGGGLYVNGNVEFSNATATFSGCRAQREGGGIKTSGNVSMTNASLMFELATAGKHGAALLASHLEQTGGDMMVYNSSASGEVIGLAGWVMDGGAFRLHYCTAGAFLMSASDGATLNATAFVVSHASAAGMLVSSGEVTLRNGVFNQTSSPQLRANVVKVTKWRVAGTEAWISWASGTSANDSIVQEMDCDDALAGDAQSDGIGCKACGAGFVFVKDIKKKTIDNRSEWQRCVRCPDGATCNATAIVMSPGMMVERQNISRALHCPNGLACRGGMVSANASTPMCARGYEDSGCSKCAKGCARSDSNVFTCLQCAEGFWRVKDVLVFLASDAVIFIISAAGVINAHRQNKNSSVYLNQLMSFTAVTAPALLALKQTGTFEQQLDRLRQVITFVSIPVQAGDAGESTTTVSTECLLRYMGLEPSLVLSQVLSSLVYLVLTLGLAVKSGASVALVVSINCFLPKFCAAFGSYLICYRMEPAPFGQRHCLVGANPFIGMTIAALAIIACFIVGPGSWIKMTRDKNLSDKPQVLFLTRSYQKGFETWEVERLIRKMLLKIISTCLPITLNPSTQMGFFSLVLMASLFLHSSQAPYAKAEWNRIEQGLLLTALVIVILTAMCLSNETHWARSDEVQISLILMTTGLVAVAGGLQSFLLMRELLLDQQPRPLATLEPQQQVQPDDAVRTP